MSTTQDPPRARFVKMRLSKRHRTESTSEEWRFRSLRRIVALSAALLVSLTLTAAASADVSFTRAYGWGVADGMSKVETCTSTCQAGRSGGGAGQLAYPEGVATDSLGDVYVADYANTRIDEFSAGGAFIKAYGWGVSDGASSFETCTSTCQPGLAGGGAGELDYPTGVATDSLGDVYVADRDNRIDEFSAGGKFIEAYGWGVSDGASSFETCTSTCHVGAPGAGAGELDDPTDVATDSSGDVYVADSGNQRIDEFSAGGKFIEAYGWGVGDGASKFETCTSTCQAGIAGGGTGQLYAPEGVATDSSGDVYVADLSNERIDEFSAGGKFIEAYGWGVGDGASKFETCTSTCQAGIAGVGAGQLDLSYPDGVATDSSGDVYVATAPTGGSTSSAPRVRRDDHERQPALGADHRREPVVVTGSGFGNPGDADTVTLVPEGGGAPIPGVDTVVVSDTEIDLTTPDVSAAIPSGGGVLHTSVQVTDTDGIASTFGDASDFNFPITIVEMGDSVAAGEGTL